MGLIQRLPLNERPREKAFLYGIKSLSNAELLAILLCTGNKKMDALELSYNLINSLATLKNLDEMSLQELSEINGIKKAKALKIKAALELHNRIEKEKICSYSKINSLLEAANYFINQNYDQKLENLQILLLDNANNIISSKIIAIGSSTSVTFSVSTILSYAMKANAKKIIIAHNHPSNSLDPSKYDLEETENIALLSSLVGIELIDHLILANDKFYSISQKKESLYEK